jgi:hypothetical protein
VLAVWTLICAFVTPQRSRTYKDQPHSAATFGTARASNDTWRGLGSPFLSPQNRDWRNPRRANNLPFLCCCPMTPVDNSLTDAALHIGLQSVGQSTMPRRSGARYRQACSQLPRTEPNKSDVADDRPLLAPRFLRSRRMPIDSKGFPNGVGRAVTML